MTTRTIWGTPQQLHLSRAARTAGEAFAFDEPETLAERPRTRLAPILFLVGLSGTALAALYILVG